MSKAKVFMVLISVLILGFYTYGCASKAQKKLSDAQAALMSAQQAGAEGTSLYKNVEDLIARANELMTAGKEDEAMSLLEEARTKAFIAKGEIIETDYMKLKSDAELQEEVARLKVQKFEASSMLQDVFFDFDSTKITPASRQVIDKSIKYIMKNPEDSKVVVIEGYCDVRGTEEYNLALGQRRADVVKFYMIGRGVPSSIIKTVGKGETDRWGAGTSDYEYSQNRRAHFIVKRISK